MQFAVCNEFYEGWEVPRICEHAQGCGYAGIEFAPFTLAEDPTTLTESDAERAGRAARDAGLEVVGLHWLLAKPDGLHLTTPDAAVRARTVEFLRHLARLCAAAGGSVMVFGSPKQRDVPDGESHDDAFARARDGLRAVCETAGPLGVRLALEPLGPEETNFLVTCAETVKLIEAVDHDACRLHLDVKAMSTEADPVPKVIADFAGHMAHFHANDPNRRGPGFGDVDFVPIFKALGETGYDGFVSVEVFDFSPDPETIASESIAYMRDCLEKAGA